MGEPAKKWNVQFNNHSEPAHIVTCKDPGMTIEEITAWANAEVVKFDSLTSLVGVSAAPE